MLKIKLSIVTVCFNDLASLKKTSLSIFENLSLIHEWVVVDGNSMDGTKEFLKSCPFVSNYISEADFGIYDAMNKGTKLVSGDYLIYLNAGDCLKGSGSILEILENIQGSPSIIFTGAEFVQDDILVRYRAPRDFKAVWHSVPANHQATLFSRTVLGEMPYDISFRICGDYELASKLYMAKVTHQVIDLPLVTFELGGVSTMQIRKLSNEAIKVQRTILKLPLFLIFISWSRRQISLILNFYLTKFRSGNNVSKS